MNNDTISTYLNIQAKAAPLAVFRILFGLMMCISILRFWYHGWIESLYLLPSFHFHYQGFEFVKVPGIYTYLLFAICGTSALMVSIGYKYKLAITTFFLSFTYIELMDKTTYLNHYYFISVLAFILIWLPMHHYFSIDAQQKPSLRSRQVPRWTIDILKLLLAIVYIHAGLAKLNYDWLMQAMPLTIWLPTKFDIPLLGSLIHEKWMHYLFSWGGAIYDLCIVFFLMWRPTRVTAFIMVVIFHVLTRVLFPIGMFPYIMIVSTLIFFEAAFHEKIIGFISKCIRIDLTSYPDRLCSIGNQKLIIPALLSVFMLLQICLPLRHLLYDGNVFWTEQGYRFSWRVMLMEKTGYANFKILDAKTGKRFYVQNHDFLTAFQQKQMATQPDFILEYGQYLGQHFTSQGHENIEVYVESYASLNGRKSQVYIDPNVNLMTTDYHTLIHSHLTPLND